MNKLYKHLPHKLKRRVVKKSSKFGYSNYLDFHKLSIELVRAGHREIGLEWRKTARERRLSLSGFQYSDSLAGAFLWISSIKGEEYWYEASMILEDARVIDSSLEGLLNE